MDGTVMRHLKPILLAALGGVLAYAVALEVAAAPKRPGMPAGTVLISFGQLGDTRLPEDPAQARPGDYLKGVPRAIRYLDRHRVAIQGFAIPTGSGRPGEVAFLLVRSQASCCFGLPPTLTDVVAVRFAGQPVRPPMDQVITVVGELRVHEDWAGPMVGSLFQMEADSVASNSPLAPQEPGHAPRPGSVE